MLGIMDWGERVGGGRGGRGALLLLTPPLSKVGWLTVGWLQKSEKDEKRKKSLKPKKYIFVIASQN